jgi:hypothetical protein
MKFLFGLHPVAAVSVGAVVVATVVGGSLIIQNHTAQSQQTAATSSSSTEVPPTAVTNTPAPTSTPIPSPIPTKKPVPTKQPAVAGCATQQLDPRTSVTAPCNGQAVGQTFTFKASVPDDLSKASEWWLRVTDAGGTVVFNQMLVGSAKGGKVGFDSSIQLKQPASGKGTVTFFEEDPGTRAQRNLAVIAVMF